MTIEIDLAREKVKTAFDSPRSTQTSEAQITDRYIEWRITGDWRFEQRLERSSGNLFWRSLNTGWIAGGSCKRLDTRASK